MVVLLRTKFDEEASKATAENKIAAENHPEQAEHDRLCDRLKKINQVDLMDMLRLNRAKISGDKMDQVQRCADHIMYGVPECCPACEYGKPECLYPSRWGHKGQGKWHCKGHYDNTQERWVSCGWSSDHHERAVWKTAQREKAKTGDTECLPGDD